MPVNTLGVLLVAVAILFEKLADGDFILDIPVEVFTYVTFSTNFFKPMNAYFLLKFCSIWLRAY